ncbi:MAG TPA: anaerobic glycerol-3-phosphate dehydrogenase subunit A [Syntrophobacteraceae bacterium]|nr:anaerobic glycerol-3-phosphate dehydrogenase subunit A [Syntrophobacteraceae bacterium]HBZ56841.1 anaerobic glycerol-3-phosphate dehydrogenase subunit A [Syntrophobacteraceae bacterium]
MNGTEGKMKTAVLIIGGGITGVGLARDLALRGVQCLVVERKHINAGASGANHGLLHSGARYVASEPATARECQSESWLLKRLAPQCCEDTGGLFVAVRGDNEIFVADFPGYCRQHGVEVQEVDCRDARDFEPELSSNLIAAYRVDDATVDPFRLSYDNVADATKHGARILTHSEVVGMVRRGDRICSVRIRQNATGREIEVEAEQIINASGPWVRKVAELAGLQLPVVWSKGSILVTQQRFAQRVINRLRPAADGDIIVPGGTVSLVGTTSVRVDRLEELQTEIAEVDFLVEETAKVLPKLRHTRFVRAFAGVRPLISHAAVANDRFISRGSQIIDHQEDGVTNLITVLGGKLTTYRLTAEKSADLICGRLGVGAPCLTRERPLPGVSVNDWVVAGLPPRRWLRQKNLNDALLCECEMVPVSAVAQIVEQLQADSEPVTLDNIRLHSRVGKGSCQGAFCGVRTLGLLHARGLFTGVDGLGDLRNFLESRWKGLRPVLWGQQLVQEQLQEAIHCGLFTLESLQ